MTELLDFIAPRVSGIGKHMIEKKLKVMINPATENIVINHKGRVFEIKKPVVSGGGGSSSSLG